MEDIEDLEALGIAEPSLTQPNELRRLAEEYHANFVPALDLYTSNPAAFNVASDDGLVRLAELERAARGIDRWAENQGEAALTRIEHASSNAQSVLLIVIGGLILIGAGLVYAANRVFAEVRRLYEAEQAASHRLGVALQAKNDFVADASHELRTPLTVLRGNADAGLAIDPHCAHREILEEIVDESAWMTRLVEDLLFLTRSDAAAPTLETEPVPVEPLLGEVAERSAVLVRQRGATFSTALTARGTVIADAARIEQAVLALVDNAAKFSPPGGRVNLSSSTRDGDLISEVADHGPGIAEAELARIFERFYRTDRARSRRRSGAGLGLSIARTVIEMHGGRIEAISRLGHGTRMRIHLPFAPVRPAALPTAMPSPPAELAAGRVAR